MLSAPTTLATTHVLATQAIQVMDEHALTLTSVLPVRVMVTQLAVTLQAFTIVLATAASQAMASLAMTLMSVPFRQTTVQMMPHARMYQELGSVPVIRDLLEMENDAMMLMNVLMNWTTVMPMQNALT
jgi:hypothetical protein